MSYNAALEIVKAGVDENILPSHQIWDYLESDGPIFYLCGKSGTGKTTVINALLNREDGEFFTSTDISTKAEFRFIYHKSGFYASQKEHAALPITVSERIKLFKQLNQEDGQYTIAFPEEILQGRTIVDIPGVLDHTQDSTFFDKLLNEADGILFFTPLRGGISSQEHELLKRVSEDGIGIILVFTMSDILDHDSGLTRDTMESYLAARLEKEFSHFTIRESVVLSGRKFYRHKEDHGIDILQKSMITHSPEFFLKGHKSKKGKLIQYYKDVISSLKIELKSDIDEYVQIITRENELKIKIDLKNAKERLLLKQSKTLSSLANFQSDVIERCYGYLLNPNTYITEIEKICDSETFRVFWVAEWEKHINISSGIIQTIPELPVMPNNLFDIPKIDREKLKEALNNVLDENEDDKKKTEKKKKSKDAETEEKQSALDYFGDLGINMENAAVFHSASNFRQKIKAIFERAEGGIKGAIDNELANLEDSFRDAAGLNIENDLSNNETKQRYDSICELEKKFISEVERVS